MSVMLYLESHFSLSYSPETDTPVIYKRQIIPLRPLEGKKMKCISASGLFQAYKGNCIYLFICDIYAGWPSSASSWFKWGP